MLKYLSPDTLEPLLKKALALDHPYSDRIQRNLPDFLMAKAKPCAVLILFGFNPQRATPDILYIRRRDDIAVHKGQMAFPGGRCEPEDSGLSAATALRETEEEVGLSREHVHVLGELPRLVTATGYSIQPVVGVLKSSIEQHTLKLDEAEIAESFWISVETLMHQDTYTREFMKVGMIRYPIDVYTVHQQRIWGATGAMTKNLLDRMWKSAEEKGVYL